MDTPERLEPKSFDEVFNEKYKRDLMDAVKKLVKNKPVENVRTVLNNGTNNGNWQHADIGHLAEVIRKHERKGTGIILQEALKSPIKNVLLAFMQTQLNKARRDVVKRIIQNLSDD